MVRPEMYIFQSCQKLEEDMGAIESQIVKPGADARTLLESYVSLVDIYRREGCGNRFGGGGGVRP